jgi:hypothetical protein
VGHGGGAAELHRPAPEPRREGVEGDGVRGFILDELSTAVALFFVTMTGC